MEGENVYRRVQEFFGGLNNNFSLIEDPMDVNLQMNYFEASTRIRGKFKDDEVMVRKDDLFDPNLPIENKKLLLVQMAGIPNPEMYRTLEKYAKNPDTDIKDWAKLALQENKHLLESDLLDRQQIFISTGMGGKGNKLRFFVVLINKSGDHLKPFEKKIVEDEMKYALQRYDGELEKFDFMRQYVSMNIIVPINSDLTRMFRDGINECNQFGDFLSTDFIVTNLRELSEKEICDALSGKQNIDFDDDFPPID